MAMARLTLSDIRSKIREMADVSSADVSDGLLNLFIRDGYNRIIDLERRWPFLEVSFTLTTVQDQTAYTINDFTSDDIREIASVVDPDHVRLDFISYEIAEETFETSDSASGRPMFVAYWADKIHIFPSPDGAHQLNVRAYREPNDWITAGTTPDGPEAFDLALIDYGVSRVYKMQEAFAASQEFERSFNDTVSFVRRDIMRPETYAPLKLSSGGSVSLWGKYPRFR
jgi:hypothetical protein